MKHLLRKYSERAGMNLLNLVEAKRIVTHARPGQSRHNPNVEGLSSAFDIGFVKNGKLDWSVDNFKLAYECISSRKDIEWGGLWRGFKDHPHF